MTKVRLQAKRLFSLLTNSVAHRHMAHGTRHMAHGTRHMAHGTRHTAHGTRRTFHTIWMLSFQADSTTAALNTSAYQ